MPKLFEDNSDSGHSSDNEDLKVNRDYAEKYEKWRAGEELQKLRDKYGDDAALVGTSEDDKSDSSSSEEEPELLANDKNWLRTLALIKAKDSRIYDPKFTLDQATEVKKSRKSKSSKSSDTPMYLRDYERKMILEADGRPLDEEGEVVSSKRIVDDSEVPLPYNEEQLKLKNSFKQFLEDSDDDDDLLVKKIKTNEEEKKDDAAYIQWLKGQPVHIDSDEEKDLDTLRTLWNDPKLPQGERFLRDFIFQGTSAKFEASGDVEDLKAHDDVDLAADEEEVEKQDEFERKFNFRFEEPDPEFIKSYPRTVAESLRKKDDTRAKKREERKKRKQQEEVERREEVRQLKRLKRAEIAEKLAKLRQIAGANEEDDNFEQALNSADLEGDFDPEAHSKMMEKLFSEEYYKHEEVERPKIDLDDDEVAEELRADAGSDWEEDSEPESTKCDAKEPPNNDKPGTSEDRPWRRKKSRVAAEISKDKPMFDPEAKTFDDYLDEYYKLDCEDVVGGLPCRFKYRKVEPIDFGLDAKEVLQAKDKELNSWVSIKRVVQYRRPEDDVRDKKRYESKAKNEHKKLKILASLAKKEAEKGENKSTDKKTKSKHKQPAGSSDPLAGFTEDRLRAYGLEPNKFKYTKHRFIQQDGGGNLGGSNGANKKKKSKPAKSRPVFA